FCRLRCRPSSALVPYTTLFRSGLVGALGAAVLGEGDLEGGAARGFPGGFEAHPENQRPVEQGGQQQGRPQTIAPGPVGECRGGGDRKSTRLNSSHVKISYAVFG